LSTSDDDAFVWVLFVLLVQVNKGRQASEERIARFNGTCVVVIA
jgi:hypothetical protein